MASFTCMAFLWYFPLLFALTFLHDWTLWSGLAFLQSVCAAGPNGSTERLSTDRLCAVSQPQWASVPEHRPGIWQYPEDSLWGIHHKEWFLQVLRVQGIFSFKTTREGVEAGITSECNSSCQWGQEDEECGQGIGRKKIKCWKGWQYRHMGCRGNLEKGFPSPFTEWIEKSFWLPSQVHAPYGTVIIAKLENPAGTCSFPFLRLCKIWTDMTSKSQG